MRTSRKYAIAVSLLAVSAVMFGVLGTIAPPLAEEGVPIQPQQGSPSESVGHFQNPPSYDSGWVDIRNKAGQYFTLNHGLNTSETVVDITGKQSLNVTKGSVAWKQTFGGATLDYATCVVQTSDGGYALAGYTNSFGAGGYDFWLVKTDSTGDLLWKQTYGGTGNDYAWSVAQTDDGGYALAGQLSAGSGDFYLVKTDSAGKRLWSHSYGGTGNDGAYSMVQTDDGGYALAGYTSSFGAGGNDFYLLKTDSNGSSLWHETYGGTGNDYAWSVVQTSDGGYAVAGYTDSFGAGGNDFYLVKTNSAGIMMWNRIYGGTNDDYAYSVVQTNDEGYVLGGRTYSFGAGSHDFWLVKTDSAGNMLWSKTYGVTSADYGRSVIQTSDGGYALAGYRYLVGSGYDFCLVRADSAGNLLWTRTCGGAGTEYAYYLVQTSDGGYALTGCTNSFGAGGYDFWLVKVNPELGSEHQRNLGGVSVIPGWTRTFGGENEDSACSVVQTSDGGYALASRTFSYGAGDADFWLVKTDADGNRLWSKTYGGTGADWAWSMVQTVEGGYALAGCTDSYEVNGDVWLVKTNSAGNAMWNKTYGGTNWEVAASMIQTSDGGYALLGHTYSYGAGDADLYLVKTDASGNLLWNKTYGGTGTDWPHSPKSVVQTNDGGYALAGQTDSYGAGGFDFWLVKTDATGNALWNKTYGGAEWDVARSLIQTSDGGYALTGGTISYGAGIEDVWLVKTDSAGNSLWKQTYGGTSGDRANFLVQTSDGGYALVGYTYSYGAGGSDMWLVRTDATGNRLWKQTFGGTGMDYATSVVQTSDGGYVLTGETSSYGAGGFDAWLVKTNVEVGLTRTELTDNSITLYRGRTDPYWNYVCVRIWVVKEPSWIYGDINMDGIVDAKDLYIVGRNYGQTFSLLSLGGIVAIAGVRTVKKRKQTKQSSDPS